MVLGGRAVLSVVREPNLQSFPGKSASYIRPAMGVAGSSAVVL